MAQTFVSVLTLNGGGSPALNGGGAAAPSLFPAMGGDSLKRCLQGGSDPSMLAGAPAGLQNALGDPRVQMMLQMEMLDSVVDLLSSMLLGNQLGQALSGAARGGGPMAMGAAPAGGGGGGGAASTGSTINGQPSNAGAANVGNIDVNKIVSALPAANQKAAREHFPGILEECQKQGVTDKAQIAYILATTVHESGAGAHLEEFASGSAYEGRSDLGNTQSGDGVRFKGRGYVQVTGRNNYTDWSKRLGIDLVGNPEKAEDPKIAARILVQGMKEGTFTGKKLSDYIGNGKQDFNGARRIVNGTDKASTFAATAQKILAAMN